MGSHALHVKPRASREILRSKAAGVSNCNSTTLHSRSRKHTEAGPCACKENLFAFDRDNECRTCPPGVSYCSSRALGANSAKERANSAKEMGGKKGVHVGIYSAAGRSAAAGRVQEGRRDSGRLPGCCGCGFHAFTSPSARR